MWVWQHSFMEIDYPSAGSRKAVAEDMCTSTGKPLRGLSLPRKSMVRLTLLLLSTTGPVLANSVDPDQLASELLKKPTDLDLHSLSLNM